LDNAPFRGWGFQPQSFAMRLEAPATMKSWIPEIHDVSDRKCRGQAKV
jgi:hypothetical protein